MQNSDSKIYHIIGMSPGNSYFIDEEVSYLLKTIIEKFGRVAVLVADVPAISTYIALGYPENRARRDKAIPKGNALKNLVIKNVEKLGYPEGVVKIIDWQHDVEDNLQYREKYQRISNLYRDNADFRASTNLTTQKVLETSKKDIKNMDDAVKIAVHYLLSELAFLEFAPLFLGAEKAVYVYHKNWPVYEDYISGKFDGNNKNYLDFLLIENPYETYNPIWGLESEEVEGDFEDVLERIEKTKTLRVGFANYVPAFMYREDYKNFSGIFYEIIVDIAKKYGWEIRWTEEVGYGVIVDGLDHNRFDIFASTVWPTPERIERALFSVSLYKSPVFAWVREDYNLDASSRVVIREHDISDSIATSDFSDNRKVMLPQLSDTTELLEFVASGRADFTFVEPYLAQYFNGTSKIKLLPVSSNPIRIYDNTFIMKRGEHRLNEFLNKELILQKKSKRIKELIKKYTGSENTFIAD